MTPPRDESGARAQRPADSGRTARPRRTEGQRAGTDRRGARRPAPGSRRPVPAGQEREAAERRGPRLPAPPIDDDVTGAELDRSVRAQLSGLGELGQAIARHLVMAGRWLEEDPEVALQHAAYARSRAPRVAAVREAMGLASYAAGRYADAVAELRAARRISGSPEYLAVLADCERGLGRPERALRLAAEPEVERLDAAGRAEMLIVAAGAHRDMGRLDAALVTLKVPALESRKREPWVARLRYAYADALLAAGDRDGAGHWFARADEADATGETDAAERLAALAGYTFVRDEPED